MKPKKNPRSRVESAGGRIEDHTAKDTRRGRSSQLTRPVETIPTPEQRAHSRYIRETERTTLELLIAEECARVSLDAGLRALSAIVRRFSRLAECRHVLAAHLANVSRRASEGGGHA